MPIELAGKVVTMWPPVIEPEEAHRFHYFPIQIERLADGSYEAGRLGDVYGDISDKRRWCKSRLKRAQLDSLVRWLLDVPSAQRVDGRQKMPPGMQKWPPWDHKDVRMVLNDDWNGLKFWRRGDGSVQVALGWEGLLRGELYLNPEDTAAFLKWLMEGPSPSTSGTSRDTHPSGR